MVKISKDPGTMNSLALHDLLSRLDLSKGVSDTRIPTYEDLYLANWFTDRHTQLKHQEAVTKILNWPRDDNNRVSFVIVNNLRMLKDCPYIIDYLYNNLQTLVMLIVSFVNSQTIF